jgi:hypothetical protein
LVEHTKTGKNIPNNNKNTKWPQNLPNGRKIDERDIKYTKRRPLQDTPKFAQTGFLGLEICHLANLIQSCLISLNYLINLFV